MVLLLDNYDSFTYNLYDYILQLGLECTVIRNDEKTLEEIHQINFDCIVISPGPGIPKDAGITNELIKYYYNQLPMLGICLGHQALGEFFNAKLTKGVKPVHGKTSKLIFEKHVLFDGLTESFNVMRYHSLILHNIQKPLSVIATTEHDEIMTIAHNELPIIGIQFHPESILTENGLLLMKNFFYKIALLNTI